MASIDFPHRFDFQFPLGIVSWKGKTLYQVVSKFRRVTNKNENMKSFFQPNPVTKIYRRESLISTEDKNCGSARISYTLPEKPGIVYTTNNALVADGVVDPHYPNLQSELGNNNCCLSNDVSFLPEYNARRRCRSAGMISSKFINGSNTPYFTTNKQYLQSRNRTIKQNEYVHIRQAEPMYEPWTYMRKANIYSPYGLSRCPKFTISAAKGNNVLKYVWIDDPPGTKHTVTFPNGDYDIFDLNSEFIKQQIANSHFINQNPDHPQQTLMSFGYDTVKGVPTILFLSDVNNGQYRNPRIEFLDNGLGTVGFGLEPGIYPSLSNSSEPQIVYGTQGAKLRPSYVQLYYKPSNPHFATQGGVSSSARLLRLKYNTMQKAAKNTMDFGSAMASSLAYHVPTPDYSTTAKAKTGYPLYSIPVFKPECEGMACKRN